VKTKTNYQLGFAMLCSLAGAACGDPLKTAQIIEEPRMLAVQIEADGGAATPAPGESATVRVVFAGPEGPQEVRLAYRICAAADSARGVPYCQGPVYEEGSLDAVDSLAEIAFSVPGDAVMGTRFAVLGVACPTNTPSLAEDPNDWSCDGLEKPLSFSFDARVGGEDNNDNPDLDELVIDVDGQLALLEDVAETPVCAEGTPEINSGEKTKVTIDYGALAREDGEWLQASHFATSGEYERQFTIIEPAENLTTEIEWKAGKSGISKHYLVLRDGFGGVAFSSFSVCVN
jgi:hypothetical protein